MSGLLKGFASIYGAIPDNSMTDRLNNELSSEATNQVSFWVCQSLLTQLTNQVELFNQLN